MRAVPRIAVTVAVVILTACGDPAPNIPTTAPPELPPGPTSSTSGPVPSTASTPTTSTPTTSTVATTPPPDPSEDLEAAAVAAFEVWVSDLGSGEFEAAWTAMAPTSQQAIGPDEFFGGTAHAMAEGWGAWSVAEEVSYAITEDAAGRTVLEVSGTVEQEGMTETRTVTIPIVVDGDQVLLSPFEEFGNVAEGVRQDVEGVVAPPVPAESGEGRRIVYSNSDQRVWMVENDGSVTDSYLVSGKQGVPAPGTYEVFSRSETAFAGHDDITMRYMVRFAHGRNLAIGFHAIPNDGAGNPLQSEEALGEYHSAGCVRQSLAHAAALYEWAPEGTPVVVLA